MHTNILTVAASLSDDELLNRLQALARNEREATAELVAHLATLDTRALLYAANGYGSLFSYCTQALHFSEDAACNRIEAARLCRRYPCVLELLTVGALSLTSIRLLGRHLTAENHRAVLARAQYKSRRDVEALVAELSPRADVPSLVRKLPSARSEPMVADAGQDLSGVQAVAPAPAIPLPAPRPVVAALASERYRVQFTIGQETQEKLRRLQALLRREIPDGDPGAIFDRAVTLLLDNVERKKLGKAQRPRPHPAIRPGTDGDAAEGPLPPRDPPNAVKRAVWARDQGRCAYVSPQGRRCEQRTFIEFHHRVPYGKRGQATVDNIALRCWRHNQYEAQLVFGDPEARSVTGRPHGDETATQSSHALQERGAAAQVRAAPRGRQDLERDLRGVEPRDGRRQAARARGGQAPAESQSETEGPAEGKSQGAVGRPAQAAAARLARLAYPSRDG